MTVASTCLAADPRLRTTPIPKPCTLPQSTPAAAGERRYAWPSAYGGPENRNFIDDQGLQPPFRLRYALRSGGHFKHPVCATFEDVVYVTLEGLVVCTEQATGRLRWRRKLPHQVWTRASLLCAEGKVYVARMFSERYPMVQGAPTPSTAWTETTGPYSGNSRSASVTACARLPSTPMVSWHSVRCMPTGNPPSRLSQDGMRVPVSRCGESRSAAAERC